VAAKCDSHQASVNMCVTNGLLGGIPSERAKRLISVLLKLSLHLQREGGRKQFTCSASVGQGGGWQMCVRLKTCC